MATHNENQADWLNRLMHYRNARHAQGYKYPGLATLYEAQACSGLPSAAEGFADAEGLLVSEIVADILNPPAPTPPPAPPPGVHHTIIGYDVLTNDPVHILDPEYGAGVVLAGATNVGKSHALAVLLSGLPELVLIYAPDTKREIWRILHATSRRTFYPKPGELFQNILECLTNDPVSYYTGFMELLAGILEIDDATWPDLATILIEMRTKIPADKPMPCLAEWVNILHAIGDRRKRSKFHTAANRFMILSVAYGATKYCRRGVDLFKRYSAIGIDYAGISHQVRRATDAYFTFRTLQVLSSQGHSSDLKMVVAHDEGLNTFGRAFTNTQSNAVSYQETLTAQGRSYGVGRIFLFQFIRQGMDTVFGNSAVIFIMRLPDPEEAKLATKYLGIPVERADEIMNLPQREGFLKSPTFPVARRIRISNIVLSAYPSDAEIAAAMTPEIAWLRANSIMAPVSTKSATDDIDYAALIGLSAEPVAVVPSCAVVEPPCPLVGDWVDFLTAVEANPDAATITEIYTNLPWGTQRCHKTKTQLLQAGLINVVQVKSAGGRPAHRVALTSKALRSLEAFRNHEKGA